MSVAIRKVSLLFAVLLILLSCGLLSCGSEPGFGIYLVDTGELVLSENHIKAYHGDTHVIELNEAGIEKWNSYLEYETVSTLADSLYSRDFVLKVEGETMYQGKFWSIASSVLCDGVKILDALFERDAENNTISIGYTHPGYDTAPEDDPRNRPEITEFFQSEGLLK